MTRGLVRTSRYSPGNMDKESLSALSVGRDKLKRDILRKLTASATGKEKHYILLVGQRGVGKTHLVWEIHDRLEDAHSSATPNLRIAFLNEEEWGVASFLDLLVRILRTLSVRYSDSILKDGIEKIFVDHAKSSA